MRTTQRRTPANRAAAPRDGDMLAALDLGSNSFHMVVAQRVLGQLRVVDRLRETVRMAEGLDGFGGMSADAQARALDCLSRFGQRIADIPPARVRAVATNTVRALRAPERFLIPAEAALGHAIDVVSGREEARLVYLGVAHAQPPKDGQLRLVIDIGGGSTECIIGRGMQPLERESLQAGCIASTRRFFPSGRLSKKKWKDALTEITAEALPLVRERLLQADRIEDIDLPGLSADRRPIIAGGMLVLEAVFAALGLQRMQVSKAALREGVLYDLLGRGGADDPREVSVDALMLRYGIDAAQAARVEATALRLFDQVASDWMLDSDDRRMLSRAARLHEIGLAIAHSGYHGHGAYILEHSDIAGFSQQEQRVLAALIRTHRRGIPKSAFEQIPDRLLANARHVAALLRLAVLLHRAHETVEMPLLRLQADGERLQLTLDERWLRARPLLRADLAGEPDDMLGLGVTLKLAAE